MLETIISTTTGESFTLSNSLIVILSSIILGFVISFLYMRTHKKTGYNQGFTLTLVMLPVVIAIIILLIGNNVARAFSLAGAFSIIRFRSEPGEPKDISYILFTLAVGLTCGMGYIGYAIMFTIILCALMIGLDMAKFATPKNRPMQLRITIPENLNYEDAFDEILNEYTDSWTLNRIKTRDFGALFELDYSISIKNCINQKKFIDDLRCRNGNLNISLTLNVEEKAYV